jgi:hypothetical protein
MDEDEEDFDRARKLFQEPKSQPKEEAKVDLYD